MLLATTKSIGAHLSFFHLYLTRLLLVVLCCAIVALQRSASNKVHRCTSHVSVVVLYCANVELQRDVLVAKHKSL